LIYFDNNATTPVYKEVADIIYEYMTKKFANPNSIHKLGIIANDELFNSREKISKLLKTNNNEIYFTSGATESINTALKGIAYANKNYGKHILSTEAEHSATINTLNNLKQNGYEIEYLKIDKYGAVIIEDLKNKIREDTILVTLLAANNEIGTLNSIEEISKIIKEKNKNTYFHVDCVQVVGKIDFDLKKYNCDLASFSAHKFHGPKGVGILYKKEKTRIFPLIHGGSQERGIRGGTQNLSGIVGTSIAIKKSFENLKEIDKIEKMRNYIAEELKKIDADIITPLNNSVPNTLAVTFDNIRSDIIINALSEKNIYVSTSAACSSKGASGSRVMKSLGYSEKKSKEIIRISLSYLNTYEEAEIFVKIIKNIKNSLKFTN